MDFFGCSAGPLLPPKNQEASREISSSSRGPDVSAAADRITVVGSSSDYTECLPGLALLPPPVCRVRATPAGALPLAPGRVWSTKVPGERLEGGRRVGSGHFFPDSHLVRSPGLAVSLVPPSWPPKAAARSSHSRLQYPTLPQLSGFGDSCSGPGSGVCLCSWKQILRNRPSLRAPSVFSVGLSDARAMKSTRIRRHTTALGGAARDVAGDSR